MRQVKTGISDSDHYEIIEGLREGEQVISGGFKAVSKDLQDGKKVTVGPDAASNSKDNK
jgi:HlyD family secretion protein